MQNFWLKADFLPPKMMTYMWKPIRNNESVNSNSVTNDALSQETDDADNMDFSSDKEAIIAASKISSSEDGGTQNQMPWTFYEGVG